LEPKPDGCANSAERSRERIHHEYANDCTERWVANRNKHRSRKSGWSAKPSSTLKGEHERPGDEEDLSGVMAIGESLDLLDNIRGAECGVHDSEEANRTGSD